MSKRARTATPPTTGRAGQARGSSPHGEGRFRWPASVLLLAVWCGLVTATLALAVQLGLIAFEYATSPAPMGLEVGWLNAPLVDGLSFGAVGVALWGVARRWPRLVSFRVAAFGLTFLGFLALLVLIPGLAWSAALLLAGGLATQTTRLMAARQEALARLCWWTTPWLLVLAVGLPAADAGSQWIRQARARISLPQPASGAPDILLIVLDTVRAASLSTYGYEEPTSPWLTQFAKQAVLFEHTLSTSPWTLPAHGTLFTGRLPRDLSTDWERALDDAHPTIAETFAQRGYLTGAFVANYDYASGRTGLDRGFLRYDDGTIVKNIAGHTYDRRSRTSSSFGRLAPTRARRILDDLAHKNAAHLNREFLTWLARRQDRPVFAFLNYFDAHSPYRSPASYDVRFRSSGPTDRLQARLDAYESCIAYLDDQLRTLFERLGREGFLDNMLVVITSDHGEQFGEHGLARHGNSLYRQVLEVPLLVAFPGRAPGGIRIQDVVSLSDVAPTILDLAGLEPTEGMAGRSLSRYWQGRSAPTQPRSYPVVSEVSAALRQPSWLNSKGPMTSVVANGFHYIKNFGEDQEELFDFVNDSREEHDLVGSVEAASWLPFFRSQIGPAAATAARR